MLYGFREKYVKQHKNKNGTLNSMRLRVQTGGIRETNIYETKGNIM